MESLLPELKGLEVLDLGCGNGDYSKKLVEQGAKSVLGVDISQKMLAEAKKLETDQLQFKELAMEDLSELPGTFDVVVSSLAFHCVKDFEKLVKDIYHLLNQGGWLVFSEEHPLNTCFDDRHHSRWTRNQEGKKLHANIAKYSLAGERRITWFNTEVIKYHRPFSEIINELIQAGFTIEGIKEPLGVETEYKDNMHRTDFCLFVREKINNYEK